MYIYIYIYIYNIYIYIYIYIYIHAKLKTSVTNIQQCPEDNVLCVSGKNLNLKIHKS